MHSVLKSLGVRASAAARGACVVVPSRALSSSILDDIAGFLSSPQPLIGNVIAVATAAGGAVLAMRKIVKESNAERAAEVSALTKKLREEVTKDVLVLDTKLSGAVVSATEKIDIKMKNLKEGVTQDMTGTTEKLDIKMAALKESVSDKAKAEALMVLKDYGVSAWFPFAPAFEGRPAALTCSFSIPLSPLSGGCLGRQGKHSGQVLVRPSRELRGRGAGGATRGACEGGKVLERRMNGSLFSRPRRPPGP
jgi:hypothetical protein